MKKLRVNVLAGLVLLLLVSASAQAALVVEYKLDGGGLTPIVLTPTVPLPGSTAAGSYSLVIGGVFAISGQASSNPPGTAGIAKLLASTVDIVNLDLTSPNHRLELFIGDIGYMAPSAPPATSLVLNSHVGGSVVAPGAGNTMSFTSCVDTLNGQNTCGPPVLPGTIITAGPGTPDITGLIKGSFDDDKLKAILALGTPYSISQYLNFRMDGGSEMNFSNNTTLTPVPEPISIALLGGVLVFTSGLIRRKANRKSAV